MIDLHQMQTWHPRIIQQRRFSEQLDRQQYTRMRDHQWTATYSVRILEMRLMFLTLNKVTCHEYFDKLAELVFCRILYIYV